MLVNGNITNFVIHKSCNFNNNFNNNTFILTVNNTVNNSNRF